MKFWFDRSKYEVIFRIGDDSVSSDHMVMRAKYEFQHVAKWVFDAVNQGLEERVRQVRQTSYEQGWKDAKAKKKKVTHFSVSINSDCVGH